MANREIVVYLCSTLSVFSLRRHLCVFLQGDSPKHELMNLDKEKEF